MDADKIDLIRQLQKLEIEAQALKIKNLILRLEIEHLEKELIAVELIQKSPN